MTVPEGRKAQDYINYLRQGNIIGLLNISKFVLDKKGPFLVPPGMDELLPWLIEELEKTDADIFDLKRLEYCCEEIPMEEEGFGLLTIYSALLVRLQEQERTLLNQELEVSEKKDEVEKPELASINLSEVVIDKKVLDTGISYLKKIQNRFNENENEKHHFKTLINQLIELDEEIPNLQERGLTRDAKLLKELVQSIKNNAMDYLDNKQNQTTFWQTTELKIKHPTLCNPLLTKLLHLVSSILQLLGIKSTEEQMKSISETIKKNVEEIKGKVSDEKIQPLRPLGG